MRSIACVFGVSVAAFATTAASGAIIGSTSSLTWTTNGSLLDSRSFLVSALLPEYYRAESLFGGYQAFLVDLNENSLSIVADFAGAQSATFAPGTIIRIELPETIDVTAFTVSSLSQATGLSNANLSFAGRALEINVTGLQFSQAGGRADMAFSFVPAPGAIALMLTAGRVLNLGRRRS